ncbi:MAG: FtsQ-type POTRA domain-containing protein [Bacilli bacterium]|nr:FtsQ-type POTRA domain-containing protein [Bacilli bacterium]
MKRGTKTNRVRLRYDRILKCVFVIVIIGLVIYHFLNVRLTNIYIQGNHYLSDQSIIEISSLQNYPKMIKINKNAIIANLTKQNEIIEANVIKKYSTIIIEVKEAKPLYYDLSSKQIILTNGKTTNKSYNLPILVNYIPNTIIEEFHSLLATIDEEVFVRISEIKYAPNIDTERFLLTMNDGNYVYINLNRFDLLDNYLTIISNFKGKKGIIYLDSGSHFKLFEKS